LLYNADTTGLNLKADSARLLKQNLSVWWLVWRSSNDGVHHINEVKLH